MNKKVTLFGFYSASMLILLKWDKLSRTEVNIQTNINKKSSNSIKYKEFIELFNSNLIFSDKDQLLNLSIPFNREIKKIYDLDVYYVDYENYDFNKLSDLFLNIHIFIN
jgi:hypothetical protein